MKTGFEVVELFPEAVQKKLLADILKGRRRYYSVHLNGRAYWYQRNVLRDYLKQKLNQ